MDRTWDEYGEECASSLSCKAGYEEPETYQKLPEEHDHAEYVGKNGALLLFLVEPGYQKASICGVDMPGGQLPRGETQATRYHGGRLHNIGKM